MRKFFKTTLLLILVLLVLFQFYPKPQKNDSDMSVNDIKNVHFVSPGLDTVLQTSCYDCHSNKTTYRWYFSIQPIALWLGNHIEDGKKELNFSEFATYSIRRKYKKLEEIIEQVKEKEMPLKSYTFINSKAQLSKEQQLSITEWASNLRDSIKANYPADSLLRKK